MIISVIAYFVGMFLLGTLTPETSRGLLTLYMTIVGIGVGFSFSLLPTASIHDLEPRFRGSATSTNSFLRSFGMTLGITIFGAIQNHAFTSKLADSFKGMGNGAEGTFTNLKDSRELFQSEARANIPDFVLNKIVQAMSDSITLIFMLALIPISIAVITVFCMGNTRVKATHKKADIQK